MTALALVLCCAADGKFALAFFHHGDGPHAIEVIAGQAVLHHGQLGRGSALEAFGDNHEADHEFDCECGTLANSPAGFELSTFQPAFWVLVSTADPMLRWHLSPNAGPPRFYTSSIFIRHQTLLI